MAKKDKSKYSSLRGAVGAGKEQLEQKGRGGALDVGELKFWKPKKGVNLIDIIPYEVSIERHPKGILPGELFQQLVYKIHFGVGADNKTVACPASVGKKCPICERRAELFKDPNADKEELDELRAKDRIAFNIIDLNDQDAGVQVFDMSPHLFANILYEEIEAEDRFQSVFDLDGGFTIKARFGEKKMGKTTFLECTRVDFEERDAYGDDVVADTLDLDLALNIMDYKKLEALFMDLEPEAEEKPAAGRSRRGKEPEPEEPEEEPEPEEKPAGRSRAAKEEKKSDGDPCPHGHTFGEDCEKHDECDTCTAWSECRDELDKIEAQASGGRRKK